MINELLQLAKKHKNIMVLSEGASLGEFEKHFPDRCFSFGNGVANMVSAAAGMSMVGKIPLVVSDRIFERAHEQLKEDICEPNLNVKFLGSVSGELENMENVETLGEAIDSFGPKCLKLSSDAC